LKVVYVDARLSAAACPQLCALFFHNCLVESKERFAAMTRACHKARRRLRFTVLQRSDSMRLASIFGMGKRVSAWIDSAKEPARNEKTAVVR